MNTAQHLKGRVRAGLAGVSRGLTAVLVGMALTFVLPASAADKPVKPQTRITQTLSQKTYKQMEIAQKAFEAKDYKGAEAALNQLKTGYDKLNDYEKATLWNLFAAVYRSEDDNKKALDAYTNLLKQNNVPDGLRDSTLFAMAQTFFVADDYKNAIRVLNKWFSLVKDVQPDAYVLLAQAYYQLQQYKEAKQPLLTALSIAKQRNLPFKENWLGLLRAVFYELMDYPHATQVMELLVTSYPKDSYFLQLSGLYGLSGNQAKQAEVMHIAYLGGYVTKAPDLINLARLYLAQGAPARAVDVLKAQIRNKTLPINAENLQLLAQSLSLAKETEQSIPVLEKLSSLSGESKHYLYLGQAYVDTGEWTKAADALKTALTAKDVANPDSVHMQLGTALYNGKKLADAKAAFEAIPPASREYEPASNWVKFINSELQRNATLSKR